MSLSPEMVVAIASAVTTIFGGIYMKWSDAKWKRKVKEQKQKKEDEHTRKLKALDVRTKQAFDRVDTELDEAKEELREEREKREALQDRVAMLAGAVEAYRRCPSEACPFRNGHADTLTLPMRPVPAAEVDAPRKPKKR